MLKKLCMIVYGTLITINSFATTDIAASETSSTCDTNVLGATEGDVNFDAKWQANEVQLRWYSQGTQLNVQDAAQTCDYDDTLTIPSTQPQRTGYVFAGWRVVKCQNLFDKNESSAQLSGFVEREYVGKTSRVVEYNGGDKTLIIKVNPDTTYKITRNVNINNVYDRIRILSCTTFPTNNTKGVVIYNLMDTSTSTATFTTLQNTQYIAINVRNSGAVGDDWQEYLDSFQVLPSICATQD